MRLPSSTSAPASGCRRGSRDATSGGGFANTAVLPLSSGAKTATATVDAQADICHQLGRPDMPRAVSGFNRPNLTFEVQSALAEAHKLELLERLLAAQHGSGIVYAGTRKAAEAYLKYLYSD